MREHSKHFMIDDSNMSLILEIPYFPNIMVIQNAET